MKNFTKSIKSALLALFLGIVSVSANAQSGNALSFDGINDYVEIPYNSTWIPTVNSFQVFVNITGNNGNSQAVLNCGGNSGGYKGFGLYAMPDSNWYIFYGTGATSFQALKGTKINYGTWTNIAGTYDGIALRMYVNGVLVNSISSSSIILPDPSLPVRLGAGNSEAAPLYFFGGEIDELSLWNKTLSLSDIQYNMGHTLFPTQSNLVAYYDFNEGVANGDNRTPPIDTLIDRTANSLNGTLFNFALIGTSSNWVASSLGLLPINLINFSGSKKDGYNLLQWSTASEQNSSYFEIQRSENSVDFTSIAKVAAAGNSSITKNYQYSDDQISSAIPIYYYRLRMVDIDGSAKYSSIIFIKNSTGGLTSVYPNPARDQVTINVADKSLINTQVLLSSLNGKVLQRIPLNQTSTQVNISNYAKGMYILKFVDGSTIKIVKE